MGGGGCVLNDFIDKALTTSASCLFQNVRYISVFGKRGLSVVVGVVCWSIMMMTTGKGTVYAHVCTTNVEVFRFWQHRLMVRCVRLLLF